MPERGRRVSLLDRMEHIAEEQEVETALSLDDDEDDDAEDEVEDEYEDEEEDDDVIMRMYGRNNSNQGADVENEEYDEVEEQLYTPAQLGYGVEPTLEDTGFDLGYGVSLSDLGYGDDSNAFSSLEGSMQGSYMDSSANNSRRTSLNMPYNARQSFSSAPERQTYAPPGEGESVPKRHSTYASPQRRLSQRRQNVNLGSVVARNSTVVTMEPEKTVQPTSIIQRMKSTTIASTLYRRGSRYSTTRSSTTRASTIPSSSTSTGRNSMYSDTMDISAVAEQLSTNSTYAAAEIVAMGAKGAERGAKRGFVQFGTDDLILGMVSIMNVMSGLPENKRDLFTVTTVNKHGYPPGEGKTEEQKKGPYAFVLCRVIKVHFDEDERYYTVFRFDSETEQRAEPGWMEPIRDSDGIEAAHRAAEQTARVMKEKEKEGKHDGPNFTDLALATVKSPLRLAMKIIPWYTMARAYAKVQVAHLLNGESNFACKFRLTGINLLVLCSFCFLFIDNAKLAFFPAHWDQAVSAIGVTVWCMLALELTLELIIRPPNYRELIESDQAYAPSTARHINVFHIVFETLALLTFLPEFRCLYGSKCGEQGISSALNAVASHSTVDAVMGRFVLGMTSLRLLGLIRHWKQMWINNTFSDDTKNSSFIRRFLLLEGAAKQKELENRNRESSLRLNKELGSSEEEKRLKNAATIGTALMVVNSHRAFFLLFLIATLLPMIITINNQNHVGNRLVDLLHENNLVAQQLNSEEDCEYLEEFVTNWIYTVESVQPDAPFLKKDPHLLYAAVLPVRCDFQGSNGEILKGFCNGETGLESACRVWNDTALFDAQQQPFADFLDIRVGGITEYTFCDNCENDVPNVLVLLNQNATVAYTNMFLFFLLAGLLMLAIFGLTVMRGDAGRLVLDPLRRMLKIVVRYAANPLADTSEIRGKGKSEGDMDDCDEQQQLGNFETEQLISAIAKIADLLRKCWGVAGAGIISTNLARTKEGKTVVFNPTVPGKRVYALFGFVAIKGFDKQLHALDQDVMNLINDVAKVVHDEAFRWALNDSGQCNRNLGAAFLMVFRIGDFNEIHDKRKMAQDVVFKKVGKKSGNALRRRGKHAQKPRKGRGRNAGRNAGRHADGNEALQLASLPGIQAFTDRALLGMLKSYAGIHRDKKLLNWKKDFRLGAGVGAFTVDVLYGMDAGWAVEGAVGSEYKIDATYLSPHVNMASRMMSASKQYGVTILMSQAVEELLSKPARSRLRHLDTVYVKGSSVAQRIFTYDARFQGVDFFLFATKEDKADRDAEGYSEKIWENDQDLQAMRQHCTDQFMEVFKEGVDQYLDGNWKKSIMTLQKADDMMISAVIDEGYVDFDMEEIHGDLFDRGSKDEEIIRIREQYGDGASNCLINYMVRRNGQAPANWAGVKKLESK